MHISLLKSYHYALFKYLKTLLIQYFGTRTNHSSHHPVTDSGKAEFLVLKPHSDNHFPLRLFYIVNLYIVKFNICCA